MGLLRSTDSGQTWADALSALSLTEIPPVAAVALSPTFASDGIVIAGTAGGVLRSIDRGGTWEFRAFGSPPPFVSALAFSPNFERDGLIFAGTLEDGVFVSRDRGSSWHAWNFGLLDLNVLALAISPAFAEDETIFVAVESGVFRSGNGGLAWRETPFDIDDAPVLSLAISPHFDRDGVLYAGTEDRGLFKSEDAGETWRRLAANSIQESVDAILIGPDFPARPAMLALVGGELLISSDGGETWQPRGPREAPIPSITAVLAPWGLQENSPLLARMADQGVKIIV
jgi:photosystem II stability/assembly factor-like uncharacterized protein